MLVRSAAKIIEAMRSVLPITIPDLVPRDARNAEFSTERRYLLSRQ
jgi:hypothetical protein